MNLSRFTATTVAFECERMRTVVPPFSTTDTWHCDGKIIGSCTRSMQRLRCKRLASRSSVRREGDDGPGHERREDEHAERAHEGGTIRGPEARATVAAALREQC